MSTHEGLMAIDAVKSGILKSMGRNRGPEDYRSPQRCSQGVRRERSGMCSGNYRLDKPRKM